MITSLTIAGMSTILTSRPSYHEATDGLAGPAAQAGHAPAHLPAAIGRPFSASFDGTFAAMAVVVVAGAALGLVLR